MSDVEIHIDGEIGTGCLIANFIEKKMLEVYLHGKRIVFCINSTGGSIDDVRDVIGFSRYFDIPFDTKVIEKACSSAFILFCYGERRISYQASSFFYHPFSHRMSKNFEKPGDLYNAAISIDTAISNIQIEKVKAYLLNTRKEEAWFTVDFLEKNGIITQVL